MLKTLALTVLLAHLASRAAASLRRAARGQKARKVHRANFGDLVECQVAYDRLRDQCSRGRSPLQAEPEQSDSSPVGSLVHDADDGLIINPKAPNEPAEYKYLRYRPPESLTGAPSEASGWDYRLHGDDWAKLGECGGPNQSPVDLPRYVDVQGQTKSLLWFDYYVDPDLKPSKVAHLVNDGHGLRYDVPMGGIDLGCVKIGAREYTVSDYIIHAPSEHSLDGALFPLELQIYHRPKEGEGRVAVAVFFREGPSNPFLAALSASMHGAAPMWDPSRGSNLGTVLGQHAAAFDLEAVLPRGDAARERSFYNYVGSLTQPPCTTGISWWILSTPITASREEIRFVRRAVYSSPSMRHGNARSAMPLGNRTISAALAGFQNSMKPGAVPQWSKFDEAKEPRGYSSQDAPWGQHWFHQRSTDTEPTAATTPGPAAAPASKSTDEATDRAVEEAAEEAAEEALAEAAEAGRRGTAGGPVEDASEGVPQGTADGAATEDAAAAAAGDSTDGAADGTEEGATQATVGNEGEEDS